MTLSKSGIFLGLFLALTLMLGGTALAKGQDDAIDHESKAQMSDGVKKPGKRIEDFRAQGGLVAPIHAIDAKGVGKKVGMAFFKDGKDGLDVKVRVKGLKPGEHGFHVHAGTSCAPAEQNGVMTAGLAAGGHYDPAGSGKHMGPGKGGHKGDLPALKADAEGVAKAKFTVPGLSVKDIKGKAVVVHAGGDNYADTPAPLGGGGARIACGVIE